MGDMADWAFDRAIEQEIEYLNKVERQRELLDLPEFDLSEALSEVMEHPDYEDNKYTELMLDLYILGITGEKFSSKQRLAVVIHIIVQEDGF